MNTALGDRIKLVVDVGQTKVGLEFTIIKVVNDGLMLRPGGLPVEEFERVAGVPVKRAAKGV